VKHLIKTEYCFVGDNTNKGGEIEDNTRLTTPQKTAFYVYNHKRFIKYIIFVVITQKSDKQNKIYK
jgi:hypothetical protein